MVRGPGIHVSTVKTAETARTSPLESSQGRVAGVPQVCFRESKLPVLEKLQSWTTSFELTEKTVLKKRKTEIILLNK